MPTLKARVPIDEIMEMLDLVELPPSCRFRGTDELEMEVEVSQRDVDSEATEVEPEPIWIDSGDLRDGLRYLRDGNAALAQIMLTRVFNEDVEARKVVEEELRPGLRAAA